MSLFFLSHLIQSVANPISSTSKYVWTLTSPVLPNTTQHKPLTCLTQVAGYHLQQLSQLRICTSTSASSRSQTFSIKASRALSLLCPSPPYALPPQKKYQDSYTPEHDGPPRGSLSHLFSPPALSAPTMLVLSLTSSAAVTDKLCCILSLCPSLSHECSCSGILTSHVFYSLTLQEELVLATQLNTTSFQEAPDQLPWFILNSLHETKSFISILFIAYASSPGRESLESENLCMPVKYSTISRNSVQCIKCVQNHRRNQREREGEGRKKEETLPSTPAIRCSDCPQVFAGKHM